VNPDGDVFCSAIFFDKTTSAAERSWFQRAIQTRDFVVGDYHVDHITGKPVLVLAYPAINPEGELEAVVFASIDLNWLNRFKFATETQLPDGFTITQIDKNGVVLAHQPDSEQWLGRVMMENPLFKEILSQNMGVLEAPGDHDTPYIYAFAPLQSALKAKQAYVMLGIPQRHAYADSKRILIRNLTLLGIVALLSMTAAWFGGERLIMGPVKAMVIASRRLAVGEMNARTGLPYGKGELSQLAQAFDEMAVALGQRQAERERVELELKRSQELFRNLSTHLQLVREEERTRIARKIHDDMGQALTVLKIDLSWLNNRLAKDQEALRDKTKTMQALIDETVQTVHKISEDLRPAILDDFGLPTAIEWHAEEFEKRTGIKCKPVFYPKEFDLSKEKSTALFRIVQESLTNIIRHANATKVEIKLSEKSGILVLEIQDNGKGITKAAIINPRSFGLIGIRERAHSLGGEVRIVGSQDTGTRLTVRMPISERKDSHD
jgi:signal transduction histidine kinase